MIRTKIKTEDFAALKEKLPFLRRSLDSSIHAPIKINYAQFEQELRDTINRQDITDAEKVAEIDAIQGWHFGRGYEVFLDYGQDSPHNRKQ